MKPVGMLDLAAEYRLMADEIHAAVDNVLGSQQFINGPSVGEFEREFARRIGATHAIAVSSGTDALLCALMTLGIGSGDEVILPAFTFFATAGAVSRVGATPVFVDIDPRTFNIDPKSIEASLTDRTRAIIPVHLFGQCADMDAILAVARERGVRVIEDAAQAILATDHGRCAGALGDMACFSFYPTKNLGGVGEGGMLTTNEDALASVARAMRSHGEQARYLHDRVGGNFRLDTMKAAVLLIKLQYLDEFTERRRCNAERYRELLCGAPVETPHVAEGQKPVYHQFTICGDRRDDLRAFLAERGVATGVYYPVPLHLQECFAPLGYQPGSLPVTERMSARVLSLPVHPMLSESDLETVASSIHEFYRTAEGGSAAAAVGAAAPNADA